jgi:hypothetical protein
VKKFLILVLLIAGGLYFYGSRLPREHAFKSSVILVAPTDTVYQLVRRIGSYPKWWYDVKMVRRLEGRTKESWEQNMANGGGLMSVEVTSAIPGQRLVTTIIPSTDAADEKPKWGGKWTTRVFESAAGTEVEITEEGWIDSPFYRIFAKVRGQTTTVNSFLKSLAANFGETASPRHQTLK